VGSFRGEFLFDFADAVGEIEGIAESQAEAQESAGGAEAKGGVFVFQEGGDLVGCESHVVGEAAECSADELVAEIGDEAAEVGVGQFALDGFSVDAGLFGSGADAEAGS
jgi:hypothetical protein